MDNKNTKGNKRINNLLWLGFEKFGLVFLSAISFFVFAIYLTPTQLGLAVIAIVFAEMVTSFYSAALEHPLVRRQATNTQELSSVFWLGSVIASISILLIALIYYQFDSTTSVYNLIAVLTLSVLVSILARPFIAQLRCERNFKKLAMRTLWGKIIGAALGITAAINGAGEWSLIIQLIGMNLFSLLILLTGERKFIFSMPSIKVFKSLFYEGAPIAARKLTTGFFDKGAIIILAAVTSPAIVGYFSFARRLVGLPQQALDSAVTSYALPVFANRSSDKVKLNNFFNQISLQALFLIIPLFLFYGFFGHYFIVDIFGQKWAPATNVFVIFAFIAALQLMTVFVPPLQAALVTSKIGLYPEIIKVTLTLALAYYLGKVYGLYGVLAVVVLDVMLLNIIRVYSLRQSFKQPLNKVTYYSLNLYMVATLSVLLGYFILNLVDLNTTLWIFLVACFSMTVYLTFSFLLYKCSIVSVYKFIKAK